MAAPLNADVKNAVLRSTALLLQSASFSEISLTDIAKAAGISKGTLYYYYKSKGEILFDIAGRYLDRLAESLLEWTGDASKDTSYRRLLRYAFRSGIYDESGNLRLYLIAAAVSGNAAVREKLVNKYNEFAQMLAGVIAQRRGGDGTQAAWMLLTMMDGLLIQSQLGNPKLDVDEFVEKMAGAMEKM